MLGQVAGVAVGLKTACDLYRRYSPPLPDPRSVRHRSLLLLNQTPGGLEKSAPTAAQGNTLIDDITFMAPGGMLKRTSDLLPALTESV